MSQLPLANEVDLEKNPERRNYYRFLYHLILEFKPKVAIEIGVESGLGSRYMAMAAEQYGGWVIGIDINQLRNKPPKNYYFILGDSTLIETWNKVHRFCEDKGKVGLVFQDSSHHYNASKREWELYSQMLSKNAIWICDDISPAFHDPKVDPPGMGMVQYFDQLPGEKRLYPYAGSNCQGVVIPQR